jgi:hypothetical protein
MKGLTTKRRILFYKEVIAFNKMFAAPECQTYSLAGANRGPRQTVSLALRTMFMLKALALTAFLRSKQNEGG